MNHDNRTGEQRSVNRARPCPCAIHDPLAYLHITHATATLRGGLQLFVEMLVRHVQGQVDLDWTIISMRDKRTPDGGLSVGLPGLMNVGPGLCAESRFGGPDWQKGCRHEQVIELASSKKINYLLLAATNSTPRALRGDVWELQPVVFFRRVE
jgi:hypothetical protein